jgi:hypothetical protein
LLHGAKGLAVPRLLLLHPVASFAARSTDSFPSIPVCAVIHEISMYGVYGRMSSMSLIISARRYEPDLLVGFFEIVITTWLSVYIRTSRSELPSSYCTEKVRDMGKLGVCF